MGGFPVGFGFIFLYNSANNDLVDIYQPLAASASAAKTSLRVSCCSPFRCTIGSATSGRARCWRSLHWRVVVSRTPSTSRVSRLGVTRSTPSRTMVGGRVHGEGCALIVQRGDFVRW